MIVHIPLHARATYAPTFHQIGLALDPPGPLPIRPSPKSLTKVEIVPRRDIMRDIAGFFAQFNAASRLILDALFPAPIRPLVPLVVAVLRAEADPRKLPR